MVELAGDGRGFGLGASLLLRPRYAAVGCCSCCYFGMDRLGMGVRM